MQWSDTVSRSDFLNNDVGTNPTKKSTKSRVDFGKEQVHKIAGMELAGGGMHSEQIADLGCGHWVFYR